MIDVKLSDLGEGHGVFHDLRYTNDNYGGNQNETTFEINNISGNPMFIDLEDEFGKPYHLENTKRIKINIRGSIENDEFLQALRLIMEAEKIVDMFNRPTR